MACPRIVLTGTGPRLAGLRWQGEGLLRVGRQSGFEIVLPDDTVSRRHAEILCTSRGWVVCDLGSSGGTLINGLSIRQTDGRLRLGDLVQFGGVALRVAEIVDPPQAAPPPSPPPESVSLVVPAPAISSVAHPTPLPALSTRSTESTSSTHLSRIKTSGSFLKVQARSQRSWEQALEQVTRGRDPNGQHSKHVSTLLRAGHHLCHIASLDELLQSILEDAVNVLDAQRAALLLADPLTGQLQFRAMVTRNPALQSRRSYSGTLTDRCYRQGESLLCSDVRLETELISASSIAHGAMASIISALLRSPRNRLGVLHLDRSPYQDPFTEADFFLADALAASVSVGIESALMVERQRDQFIQTVTALARTVELRDEYTANHTQRVTDYALMLAEELNLTNQERHQIQIGAPLHDIGKIGVADSILNKPGRLTADEFEVMKSHTLKGAAILETIPALSPMIPIVRHHHEKWDGSGYPDGLRADGIARAARVVAVADAFDAMTSNRPYRTAMPVDKAILELTTHAGAHFDPLVVQAFLTLRPRIQARMERDAPGPIIIHTEPLVSAS